MNLGNISLVCKQIKWENLLWLFAECFMIFPLLTWAARDNIKADSRKGKHPLHLLYNEDRHLRDLSCGSTYDPRLCRADATPTEPNRKKNDTEKKKRKKMREDFLAKSAKRASEANFVRNQLTTSFFVRDTQFLFTFIRFIHGTQHTLTHCKHEIQTDKYRWQ